jgi:hypothetical protein
MKKTGFKPPSAASNSDLMRSVEPHHANRSQSVVQHLSEVNRTPHSHDGDPPPHVPSLTPPMSNSPVQQRAHPSLSSDHNRDPSVTLVRPSSSGPGQAADPVHSPTVNQPSEASMSKGRDLQGKFVNKNVAKKQPKSAEQKKSDDTSSHMKKLKDSIIVLMQKIQKLR